MRAIVGPVVSGIPEGISARLVVPVTSIDGSFTGRDTTTWA